jgi:neutral ceramidase
MAHGNLTRRTFLTRTAAVGAAAAAAGVLPQAPAWASPGSGAGELTAGAASRDITPDNGGEFFGYVRPDIRADGVSLRLFAHALVLDDGQRKVALVAVDLGEPMVKDRVLDHVRPLGFDESTVLLAATHTHAGPGEAGDWTAQQIGAAIAAADEARRPARAAWGLVDLHDGNSSRSIEAHLANHGLDLIPGTGSTDLDPRGHDHPRDLRFRLLRVEATDGTPIAAWGHFSSHPTTYIQKNTTFSADFPGAATRRFEERFDGDAPLAMFTNGNEGDMIPLYDDFNQHAVADRMGRRIAGAMHRAWERAEQRLTRNFVVDARSREVRYAGQEVEPGKRVAPLATFGVPFLAGGENGPSPFYELGLEGKRRPEALADPVQGRKIVAAPAPWAPTVQLQALRLGDRLLLGVPGEPTVEAGRRMRARAADHAPEGVIDVAIVGLANGYHGYFTTPEEYDQQHYEGGHTVFGKYTSLVVEHAHAELAAALAAAPSPRVVASGTPPSSVAAPTGDGGSPGSLLEQPVELVERMGLVEVAWSGGPLGRDRPVDAPFVTVQRAVDGAWRDVITDLDIGLLWREQLGTGRYRAHLDVAHDLAEGTYRFRIDSERYQLTSRSFRVVASDGIRLLGAMADHRRGNRMRVRLFAQHPPPDPEAHLRSRPVYPGGGAVRFHLEGREHEAAWDDAARAWVAQVPAADDGTRLEVPVGGLVDGVGNTSGGPVSLPLGQVAEPDWPPHLGPAGGRPPGPLGIGTFPP